jgi:xylulose-5-phosphate/fructose-6-phosphate phosphoketolase
MKLIPTLSPNLLKLEPQSEHPHGLSDMTVLNELDRFHLVMDAIDRLPQIGSQGIYLKQKLADKLFEHRHYINRNGRDLPEVRNWVWNAKAEEILK